MAALHTGVGNANTEVDLDSGLIVQDEAAVNVGVGRLSQIRWCRVVTGCRAAPVVMEAEPLEVLLVFAELDTTTSSAVMLPAPASLMLWPI